jgi:hypothetical protein
MPLIAVQSRAEAAAPANQTVEGTLIVVWADPDPDLARGGKTHFSLALDDGTVRELDVTGQESAALLNFGKRVNVCTPGGTGSGAIAAQSITPSLAPSAPTGGSTATKKVLYLLLKYADDVAVPHPPSFYTNLNNPDTPPPGEVFPSTINGFFKKTSWDQFSWIGDVGGAGGIGAPNGWLTLPNPKSYYAPCGWGEACAQLFSLTNDAMQLGREEGIDFAVYDNINFVLSNDLDCCAHGGGFYSPTEGKFFGATWEPPWGQEAHIYAHEMGHSLGLPHSGWVYYSYDSPWDVMSRRSLAENVLCGSYPSINNGGTDRELFCAEPGNGYIGPHKDYLGWIPAANEVVTDTSSSTTVTLEGLALPLGTAAKILKICIDGVDCTGPSAHYFTAEARVRDQGGSSQFDNGIPGEGVIIHEVRMDAPRIGGNCFFNDQSGFAFPVDSTPGDYDPYGCSFDGYLFPQYALFNAQWKPGQTYTNGFSLSVLSRSGSTFVVSTTASPRPTITGISPNSGTRSGGTNVTIAGTSFVPGMRLTIGGSDATNVVVVNATTITARTPPYPPGSASITVTNTLGQSTTLANGFLYTSVVPFTDSPLVAGVTVIKRVHLTELRTRIDALRARYGGLPAFSYTDPTITAGVTVIAAQHIVELREALAPAYLTATGTAATYATDPSLATGMGVKAAHVNELRTRVLAIE